MNNNSLKRIALSVTSGVLATVVTACSSGTSNEGMPDGQTATGKKVVTISVLQSDNFLKLAEQSYEQTHPDVDIRIKEYAATPDTGEGQLGIALDAAIVEKYINSVGTEVLSGKGADLISLQNLPMEKYANKKALADLSEMMAKDDSFNVGSYYGNILDSTKINGSLYAMPLGFTLNTMIGDTASIQEAGVKIDDKSWTWDDFAEFAKQLVKDEDGDGQPDKYAITNFSPESLLVNLLGDQYGQYVDSAQGQAHFDSEAFRGLLERIKGLYDEHLVSADNASWGEQFFVPWNAKSASEMILYPKSVFEKGGDIYRKPGMGQGVTFRAGILLGINARSSVKQEAWEFMKFLLSEDMQSAPEFKGLPLNKAVMDKALSGIQAQLQEGMQLMNGVIPQPLTDEELKNMKELVEGAAAFTKSDSKINAIVGEEALAYFAGQKSAEEVGKLIQNRVTTYLNE
jgi:ABC-type sugar transport system, periplasmic component